MVGNVHMIIQYINRIWATEVELFGNEFKHVEQYCYTQQDCFSWEYLMHTIWSETLYIKFNIVCS